MVASHFNGWLIRSGAYGITYENETSLRAIRHNAVK